MENHALFPVLVSKFTFDNNEYIKSKLLTDAAVNKYFINGITNETVFNSLHHEEDLKDFYKFVTESVFKYLDVLNIVTDLFDVFIHKSWLNVNKGTGNPQHNHKDSHLSFVYYVHTPMKNSIRFFGDCSTREPYDNFFTNYVKENAWNIFNSRSWSFPPTDGQLFIFPATLSHEVEEFTKERFIVSDAKDMLECRVAIAGDILLLGKEVIKGNYRAVQPYNFWRKF